MIGTPGILSIYNQLTTECLLTNTQDTGETNWMQDTNLAIILNFTAFSTFYHRGDSIVADVTLFGLWEAVIHPWNQKAWSKYFVSMCPDM